MLLLKFPYVTHVQLKKKYTSQHRKHTTVGEYEKHIAQKEASWPHFVWNIIRWKHPFHIFLLQLRQQKFIILYKHIHIILPNRNPIRAFLSISCTSTSWSVWPILLPLKMECFYSRVPLHFPTNIAIPQSWIRIVKNPEYFPTPIPDYIQSNIKKRG